MAFCYIVFFLFVYLFVCLFGRKEVEVDWIGLDWIDSLL